MDTFYPKFGEVELVLVDDDNDFYDPLESNFEIEDKEETKLQLNDIVYDESQFHLNSNESSNSTPNAGTESIKQEVYHENNDVTPNHSIKIEKDCENSNDSFDIEDNVQHYDSDSSSDEFENKANLGKILPIDNNITNSSANKSSQIDETESKTDIQPSIYEPLSKQKDIKGKTKIKNVAVAASTSKMKVKKEPNVTKKRLKDVKEVENSTEKTTRQYSKRNEIPKQAVHNEAYDKKLLNCKICNIQFEKSPFFTEHMREKHSIEKPFECFICQKAYRISSLLAEHIRYHFGEKPYKCKYEFCDRSFSQLQPYKAHIRKFHTFERPYKCDKCDESFFDTKTYKFHIHEHTGSHPFTCEFCGKKFDHSGTYQAHVRIHTNEKPYQCSICGKSFAQISTHKAHMLTHSDEFKFPCTACDKKFKQATNLKLHMRVHTKETPYKCEDCGRGFAQLVTYRNHRRIHTGEKPFNCSYDDCGKSFRHRNSFRRHLQTHTGEKPFECQICFKRLSQTSSFVAHMKGHEKPQKS